MKNIILVFVLFLLACNPEVSAPENATPRQAIKPVLVIHGGAGSIERKYFTDEQITEYENALEKALNVGYKILEDGGTALLAVERTINYLEDNPLFNAGKGSVLNSVGEVENDASIMDGSTLNAGAVAGLQNVKNPISLARMVKDSTAHVMLSGIGAFEFAQNMGVQIVDQEYFMTERRRAQRQKILDKKHGTVGCVALDKNGNIAAGTSTGGMSNKKYGRIGDSPIIGAGTYANSNFAGVSCTGHGEYFIKNAVAYDVIAMMNYKGVSVNEAAQTIVQDKLKKQNATGGLIALDTLGNVVMEFNTSGMFRGFMNKDTSVVKLFGE